MKTAAALLFVSHVLLVVPGQAAEKPWIEVKSPHFLVASDGSEKRAREVATDFEQSRNIFQQAFPTLRADSGAETIILAPKDEETCKYLLPAFWRKSGRAKPAGVFRKGWEKDYVVVRLDADDENHGVIYHEYVHKLLELNFPRLPVWLGEGLAEFLGTAQIRERKAIVGMPNPRLRLLRSGVPYPLNQFLTAKADSPYYRDQDKVGMFYAEAWGLTHFLMFGKDMENGKRMNDFLRLIQTGSDDSEAFRQSFGDVKSVQSAFEDYVRQYRFTGFVLKDPLPTDDHLTIRQLVPAEKDVLLGGYFTYFRELNTATNLLRQAVQADPKSELAHENLGFLNFMQGKDEDAEKEFDAALALDSNSYLALYYRTMLHESKQDNSESVTRLDVAMRKVITLNPRFAPAYVILSRVYVRQHKMLDALSMAQRAEALEPDRAGYHLNVAAVLIAAGDYDGAKQIASFVAGKWDMSDRGEAISLLQRIHKVKGTQTDAESQHEAALMKYAADDASIEGTILSVSCTDSKPTEVVIGKADQKVLFRSATGFNAGFSDTIWYGSDHFNLCFHVQGLHAVARYKPGTPEPGELQWLEIRDDVETKSASATAENSR